MKQLRCIDLGRRAYVDVLRLQQRLVKRLRDDPDGPAYMLLVEHDPPAVTLGRGADRSNVLVDSATLEAAGVDTVKELRNRNAKNLYEALQKANASRKISFVRQLPSEKMVTDWIAQAKQLKPAVSY